MRLSILNNGYRPAIKLLFGLVRLFTGHPMPDAARLTFYRPDFYGKPMKELTHEAMRGPSGWSVAERELMAAYVSKINQDPFCINAHTATATRAYNDCGIVTAALNELNSAPIGEPLRRTLQTLGELTSQGTLGREDMRAVLAAGVSPQQIEDALAVCFAFNTTTRLSSSLQFDLLSQEGFDAGAKYLLRRGYR